MCSEAGGRRCCTECAQCARWAAGGRSVMEGGARGGGWGAAVEGVQADAVAAGGVLQRPGGLAVAAGQGPRHAPRLILPHYPRRRVHHRRQLCGITSLVSRLPDSASDWHMLQQGHRCQQSECKLRLQFADTQFLTTTCSNQQGMPASHLGCRSSGQHLEGACVRGRPAPGPAH